MSQPAFEVPPADHRREPSAAERFARQTASVPPPDAELPADPEVARDLRTVPLKAVTDAASFLLILAGLAVGVTAAWLAGGHVAGLATLGGALIALGFLLNL